MSSLSEEEINNMKSELEKYGIQMPAFSKIGGILANELSVDEAACKRSSDVTGRGRDLLATDIVLLSHDFIMKWIQISSTLDTITAKIIKVIFVQHTTLISPKFPI